MTIEKIEPNQKEINEIQEFIRILCKAMFFGSCFILILIPLITIFRVLL